MHLLLLLLACPPDDKESTPSESGGSDSAENQESPPDTDCTAIEGYTDADGDGYGDPTLPHTGCVDDPLTADNDQDCNDAVAGIHPLAEELCDGVDQDCDSEIDENATDAQTYYADVDADGHGDPEQSTVACTAPSGSVEQADDCDDTESLAWTGATEICGDGVDQDCDPTTGACLVSGAQSLRSGDYLIQGANTTDLAGSSVAALGDWDGDGTGDLLVGAPFTNAGGTVYVVPMASGTLGGQVSWSGSAVADGLGTAVVALPDLDGDGRMELAATAPGGASLYGELEVYDSHSGSPIPREAWTGQELHGGFGSAVANLGDADGNGIPTLAVGAYAYGYLSTFGGAVFLGETDGTDKNASDLVRMEGATNTQTGWALANVGDVDGDGQEDLLVGSDPYNTALTAELAWLVTAPMAGDLVDVAAAAWERESLYEDEGTVVGGAGDVDGDGYMDLLIGAPNDSEGGFSVGAAFLILGNPSGTESLTDADAKILGSGFSYMQAGTSVAAVPDVDGDGLTDIAVGAPSADDARTMSGSVYLVPGTVRGTVTARTSAHTWWMGESLQQAGWAVGQAGDQDGDGISELWVSSVGYNGQSGAVWGFSLAGAL